MWDGILPHTRKDWHLLARQWFFKEKDLRVLLNKNLVTGQQWALWQRSMTRGNRHRLPYGKLKLATWKHFLHHGQMLEQVTQRGYGIFMLGYFPSEILKHHLIEADNEYISSLDQKTSTGPLHPKLSYDGYLYSILEITSTRAQLLTGCHVHLQKYHKLFG